MLLFLWSELIHISSGLTFGILWKLLRQLATEERTASCQCTVHVFGGKIHAILSTLSDVNSITFYIWQSWHVTIYNLLMCECNIICERSKTLKYYFKVLFTPKCTYIAWISFLTLYTIHFWLENHGQAAVHLLLCNFPIFYIIQLNIKLMNYCIVLAIL